MTGAEAVEALKADAATYEAMALPAPLVGAAVAKAVREYAEKIFDDRTPPDLKIV